MVGSGSGKSHIYEAISRVISEKVKDFSKMTPDHVIETIIQNIFTDFGVEASVVRASSGMLFTSRRRQFLINFRSNEDAIHFANSCNVQTFGFNGVLLHVE